MKSKRMPDIVCLSHLRWNFVFQRPQHLMTRFAKEGRVFFVEEPIFEDANTPHIARNCCPSGVDILVPHLPNGLSESEIAAAQRTLLDTFLRSEGVVRPVLWYYTPMALSFSGHLEHTAIVYDCMDELSAFAGASPKLREQESKLLDVADVVFTGGYSLYESKSKLHHNVHAMPSSVDVAHFVQARTGIEVPDDQREISRTRLGFFGVIDERLDIELVDGVAELRPEMQLVMLGPVVKIDPATLPRRPNIHWLGSKQYQDLPRYLAGWDVAMLPFARNESTRFISPTKTPEYLAAGKPVVSTSIRDVVRSYGAHGLAEIADTPSDFVAAVDRCLARDHSAFLKQVDIALADMSWDSTFAKMQRELELSAQLRAARNTSRPSQVPSLREAVHV